MKKLLLISSIALSINANAQWVETSGPGNSGVVCIAASGTTVFAGAVSVGMFLTNNNGNTWNIVNSLVPPPTCVAISGSNIFVGTENAGVFLSTDNGSTWTSVNTGLTDLYVTALAINGSDIFVATGSGVSLSTNNGNSWSATGLTATEVISLAVNATKIFAGTNGGGIFLSSNNGSSWTPINTGLNTFASTFVNSFAFSGTKIFAGTEGGVYLSTNNGSTWDSVNTGLSSTYIYALAINGTQIFAGTAEGVSLSLNNGNSWIPVDTGITPIQGIESLAIIGTNIFAGAQFGYVFTRPLAEMTGINELSQTNEINIYPNPATNEFQVTSSKFKVKSVNIYNVMGEEIWSFDKLRMTENESYTIDVSSYAKGVYFVEVQTDGSAGSPQGSVLRKKLIKE